jgi:hypothetical protein
MDIPGKVRIFLWRLAHNSLPTRLNIQRKSVVLDTRCPVCGRFDEDGGHIFLKCKEVKYVWRHLNLEPVRLQLLECPDAHTVLNRVLALPKQQQTLVAVTLRDWWTARNKINAGEKRKTTEEIFHLIVKHHHEFSQEPKALAEVQPVQSKWEPPPSGFVKVNFDASFIPELKNGSYGYVIRAEDGEFLAAGAGKLNHLRSALHGEAEACIAAMEGTSNLGMFRVLFESDSTTLIEAINNGNYDLADTGVLMREARSLKFLHFDNA